MSIIYESENGCLLSHANFIKDIYSKVEFDNTCIAVKYKDDLFAIENPYKKNNNKTKRKRKLDEDEKFSELFKAVNYVKTTYEKLKEELKEKGYLQDQKQLTEKNTEALELARIIYDVSKKNKISNSFGGNAEIPLVTKIGCDKYYFPKNCKFFCKNVTEINELLRGNQYDLILLDPPWWNKYIRRTNSKSNSAYGMMYNDDLKNIPIENLLKSNGMIVVWCTNSQQNLQTLLKDIFSKWNVKYIGRWYWMKITLRGEPVCNFSQPPGKQPFEQIIFGLRDEKIIKNFQDGKVIASVPSALHSHKPPLLRLLQPYLPDQPECLEIFARYLLPNWTSFGLEAILLQHEALFEEVECSSI